MTGVYLWSTTAATNASVDSTINLREGQSPGSVNDSIRALMAGIAKFRDDISGNLVTGGTATALTLTSSQTFLSLVDGMMIRFRMTVRNGAAATLNVDGLGAKALASLYGTALPAGALPAGSIQAATYDSTDDKWIVHGVRAKQFSSGEMKFTWNPTPDAGWLMSNGRTVGNASSNATLRANADTEDLFTALWVIANTEVAIYDSAGVASTRGASAAADYAANKAIATVNMAAAVPMGLDDLGIGDQGRISVLAPANGKIVGAETTTLVTANMPVTTPAGTVTKPTITLTNGTNQFQTTSLVALNTGATGLGGASGVSSVVNITASLDSTPQFTGTPFGSGTAHSNVQTSALGYWWVAL